VRTRHPKCGSQATVAAALLAGVAVGAGPAFSSAPPPAANLAELSIEDLMQVEVTSVSKKAQPLFDTPAAIYVITQEDIRRSGATSIPEALRMAPGVDVARITANIWAISIRGFNGQYANKLLVLIDGRSVYSPLFAGVFWNSQDTLIEDIERIEVIRGPGGTIWGANAVNGVINVITKSAKDTTGGLLTAGGGKDERAGAGVRYGATLAPGLYGRVYAKYFNQDAFQTVRSQDAGDQWNVARGGFRLDWDATAHDLLTLQGDLYKGHTGTSLIHASLTLPFATLRDDLNVLSGGNLLGRWTHTDPTQSTTTLQWYYDRTSRSAPVLHEDRNTVDVELTHRRRVAERQNVIAGLGYRLTTDHIHGSFDTSFDPSHRNLNIFNAFLQDEITLLANRLWLTLGSKVEHNDYTGFEYEPSGRILWTPAAGHSVWGAISRAVRIPSQGEEDLRFNTTVFPPAGAAPPTLVSLFGNRAFRAETLLAYELGYRLQPTRQVFFDLAAFYGHYEHLNAIVAGTPFPERSPAPAHVVVPLEFDNTGNGEHYGLEITANWNVTTGWTLAAGYSYLDLRLSPNIKSNEGTSPHNQFHLRSYLGLPGHFEFDAALYYVDNLPNQGVASYIRPDIRLGWRPLAALDLSFVVQDISDTQHAEFGSIVTGGLLVRPGTVAVPRAIFGQVRWRF
jgi:iron complex outermembrane recepter protein